MVDTTLYCCSTVDSFTYVVVCTDKHGKIVILPFKGTSDSLASQRVPMSQSWRICRNATVSATLKYLPERRSALLQLCLELRRELGESTNSWLVPHSSVSEGTYTPCSHRRRMWEEYGGLRVPHHFLEWGYSTPTFQTCMAYFFR